MVKQMFDFVSSVFGAGSGDIEPELIQKQAQIAQEAAERQKGLFPGCSGNGDISKALGAMPLVRWKALSIRQPWAWLIVNGYKDIENRSWDTRLRGRFLVHAGKVNDPYHKEIRQECRLIGITIPDKLDKGGIVGVSMLADVMTRRRSRDDEWFDGPFGFLLKDSLPLPFQAVKGQLGFFNLDYPDLDYHRLADHRQQD